MKTIYFAGGCFWGVERYFSLIPGVLSTLSGYANGSTDTPTYEEVCAGNTGYVETVKVEYDPMKLSLTFLLEQFYKVIDPTTLNRQGGDIGEQYRTGIYYTEEQDREIILGSLALLQESLTEPIMTEVKPLQTFFPAEDYHQKYLVKNPSGYCHINPSLFEQARNAVDTATIYRKKDKDELRKNLTDLQFEVTQNAATELAFSGEYDTQFDPGIYVDITTGEPLFISTDKFEAGCGWPSFSKPISQKLLRELPDNTHGRERIEVRSESGDSHLGHVFSDGPEELGGLRYCINSAALRFVPKEEMEKEGYGNLLSLLP